MSYMPPFPPDAPEPTTCRSDHGWIVAHMIGLIGYCEAEGLAEAERALTEATERLAPLLNGHRLAQMREARMSNIDSGTSRPMSGPAALVLRMPLSQAARSEPRHVPA
jgi:hypothetical protein